MLCVFVAHSCACVSEASTISTCTGVSFQCGSGACIPMSRRCDGTPDCPDQSDEKNCDQNNATTSPTTLATAAVQNLTLTSGCGEHEFQCKSDVPACIHWSLRCDNAPDCRDQSDEENCNTTTPTNSTTTTPRSTTPTIVCGEFEFQCKSNAQA